MLLYINVNATQMNVNLAEPIHENAWQLCLKSLCFSLAKKNHPIDVESARPILPTNGASQSASLGPEARMLHRRWAAGRG